MASVSDLIQRLSQEDPEVSEILRTFAEVDQLYREAIQATDETKSGEPAVKSSAEVRISFRSYPSDSTALVSRS